MRAGTPVWSRGKERRMKKKPEKIWKKSKMHTASLLKGTTVANLAGEELGTVEEIVIHTESGTVVYAVLSFAAALRMGDSLFAIPWKAFTYDNAGRKLILNVNLETLEEAPGFQKDNWPDMGDPEWGEIIYTYYGYRPSWE